MSEFRFEWDARKAALNVRQHGVTFEEATSAFADELAIDALDEKHSRAEERRVLIGLSNRFRFLTVVYTERHEKVRLINARKSSREEKARYAFENRRA